MDTPMTDTSFRMLALLFGMRDALRPRRAILEEVPLRPGDHVLDYGCGPGGYTLAAAAMVGPHGNVVAADLHPLAVERVEGLAGRGNLTNVTTVRTDRDTGLPGASIDVVLLYDILHGLSEPGGVLEELHRVLRPHGVLSVIENHIGKDRVVALVTAGGMFRLLGRGKGMFTFSRVG